MKCDGESEGVTVDISRPSSWSVGGGNAGGGGAAGMIALKMRVGSPSEGAGVIGGSSLWMLGLGV